MSATVAETWVSYVDSLTWAKHHLDESSWSTFLRGGSLGIDPTEALNHVVQRIKDAGDFPKTVKLKSQLQRAYAYAGAHAGELHVRTEPKAVYRPDKLAMVAKKVEREVTPEWLAARSKFTLWNRSPAGFLHKLYKEGEKVVVFDVFESQGCGIWTHPGIAGDLSTLDYLEEGKPEGVWFLANPVDGEYHWNPRQNKQSRRSEEAITSWRYWVIESDEAPKDLWLKALVQLPLPIAAIYDSGGDSIHALALVNAASKAEWDRIVRKDLGPLLVPLGADLGSMTGVRLSRLPKCRRGQTGNVQSLLYLNPEPDYTPIAEL
jgi:hypothetical protein